MEEKDILMNEQSEETTKQPAWEVIADIDVEEVEEVLEDAEEELKRGVSAIKDWMHNTLYEANRVFREHKFAVLAVIGAIAAAAAAIGVLCALLKKKD